MDDDNSLSERILRSLENIIINDPNLREFSIVPAVNNTCNKSPVLYEEHNLGLESWCIKHIYRYTNLELFEVRPALRFKKLSRHKMHNLNYLLIGALLINPDVTTFWNMKRELVECEILPIEGELYFSKIILTNKSKSNEALGYRRWLIKKLLNKPDVNLVQILQNEFDISEMASNKSQNNYHSWTHRIWCMENIGNKINNFHQILINELDFIYNWIYSHVSEHTGYHYRQYLFKAIKDSKNNTITDYYYSKIIKHLDIVNENDPKNILLVLLGGKQKNGNNQNKYVKYFCLLLFDLLQYINKLNDLYPNHESLFYHRKFLLFQLIKTAYEYHELLFKPCKINSNKSINCLDNGEKQPKLVKTEPNKVKSSFLYKILIRNEQKFISENMHSTTNQCYLVKNYEKWLKSILGFDI